MESVLKYNLARFKAGSLILVFSILIGEILSLVIGLRFDRFIWISQQIVILDSLALGVVLIVSSNYTRTLVENSTNVLLILLLSFGMMLGTGIIAFFIFFISSPISFLYANNRSITFLLVNLLFFISINIILSLFEVFQYAMLQKEKALHEEKVMKAQMELKLLASKVNPHFLFNSLNLLVSLLKTPEKAEKALIDLSDILRYQLDFSDDNVVPLKTELSMVEKYLSLQQMRFLEKLSYDIDCDIDGKIPPLILQPLVENCIKHNIDDTDRLHITIKIIEDDEHRLILNVKDSMARLSPEMTDKGVGLTVTRKRVEHYGGRFRIDDGGVEITFKP